MQAKPRDKQEEIFKTRLDRICDEGHALRKLSRSIQWSEFDKSFGGFYSEGQGRPAKPTRLMCGSALFEACV